MFRLIIFFFILTQANINSQNPISINIKENILNINLNKYLLQEGDILFQDLDSSPLCDAIEKVTTSVNNKNFSHVGICIIDNSELFVLEAFSNGVELVKLEKFIKRSLNDKGYPKISVGRVLPIYKEMIKPAINKGENLIGKKYDEFFSVENDKYYCSELIYDIFDQTNFTLFELKPMTFKEPKTNRFMPIWIDYFSDLSYKIPEGMLGINPGLISRSKNINIIYDFEKY